MVAKLFQSWTPGKLCSLKPAPIFNLNNEYTRILENAVEQNLPLLSSKLGTESATLSVIHALFSQSSEKIKETVTARRQSVKQMWPHDARYSALLRQIYSPKLVPKKVIAALRQLPDSQSHPQSQYIQADHLERLITRSMPHQNLFPFIYRMIRRDKLPISAREHAQYILHEYLVHSRSPDSHSRQKWTTDLAQLWKYILSAKDTGAYNTLLKLGFLSHSRDTVSLIKHHMTHPDRFTYLVRLRHETEVSPKDILHEFSRAKFVPDIVVITSYLSSLVSSHIPHNKRVAENVFEKLIKDSNGCKAVSSNPHNLAGVLKALDTVNQISSASEDANTYQVPVVADAKLFERMYIHYISNANHAAAIDVLISMTDHGYLIPRHVVRNHMSHTTLNTPESIDLLEKLFYICCEANTIHPGFISDSLAEKWVEIISQRTSCTLEDAENIVTTNRNMVLV